MKTTEKEFKMMTNQLRITNSEEDVANYLRWIIGSDTAKEYWIQNLSCQPAVCKCKGGAKGRMVDEHYNQVCEVCGQPAVSGSVQQHAIQFGKYLSNTHNTGQWEPEDVEKRVPEIYEDYLHFCKCGNDR